MKLSWFKNLFKKKETKTAQDYYKYCLEIAKSDKINKETFAWDINSNCFYGQLKIDRIKHCSEFTGIIDIEELLKITNLIFFLKNIINILIKTLLKI